MIITPSLETSRKRADDLEAKLKAADKALEEANAKLASKADEVVEIKSQVASREAEICLRLDKLNSSFTSKFEFFKLCWFFPWILITTLRLYFVIHLYTMLAAEKIGTAYQMHADQCKVLLLDSLTILEANSVRVRNVLVQARRAFSKFFGHFFPKQKETEDLLDLVDSFSSAQDPVLSYRRSTTKSGLEVAMAMVMAHEEVVDWEKVSSSHATDAAGAPKSLVPFIRKARAFSKKMIPLECPTEAPPKDPSAAAPSSSSAPSEVQ
jgi:hypothetical protein